jgi:hypothetical protein
MNWREECFFSAVTVEGKGEVWKTIHDSYLRARRRSPLRQSSRFGPFSFPEDGKQPVGMIGDDAVAPHSLGIPIGLIYVQPIVGVIFRFGVGGPTANTIDLEIQVLAACVAWEINISLTVSLHEIKPGTGAAIDNTSEQRRAPPPRCEKCGLHPAQYPQWNEQYSG